jgi:hypothetical protein
MYAVHTSTPKNGPRDTRLDHTATANAEDIQTGNHNADRECKLEERMFSVSGCGG